MNSKKIASTYNKIADSYKSIRDSMQITNEIYELYNSIEAPNPKILDAGCGPGRDLETFVSLGSSAFGIDITERFVNLAKERNPFSNVIKGDIKSLNYDNNFFDAIWCCAVLSHIHKPHIPLVLSEFHKVLKTNGYISILVREGYGTEYIEDDFKGTKRFFVNFQRNEFINFLVEADFDLLFDSSFNERERFGSQYRDINFLYFKAKKKSNDNLCPTSLASIAM